MMLITIDALLIVEVEKQIEDLLNYVSEKLRHKMFSACTAIKPKLSLVQARKPKSMLLSNFDFNQSERLKVVTKDLLASGLAEYQWF